MTSRLLLFLGLPFYRAKWLNFNRCVYRHGRRSVSTRGFIRRHFEKASWLSLCFVSHCIGFGCVLCANAQIVVSFDFPRLLLEFLFLSVGKSRHLESLNALGLLRLRNKEFQKAVDVFKQVISLDKHNSYAHVRGSILMIR